MTEKNPEQQKKANILIIDDDFILCNVFKDILEHTGYAAFIAQKEEEILSIAYQEDIDLVYIDLEMPGLDSLDISNKIKKVNPSIVIVLISGYTQQIIEEEMNFDIHKGAFDKFIDKGDIYNLPKITDQLLKDYFKLTDAR